MKILVIQISLLISILGNNCFAIDSIALKLNDPAPFAGVLMSSSKAQTIRTQLLERDTLLEEKDSYEKSLKLYSDITQLNNQKISILSDENERLSKQLSTQSVTSNWERVLYFGLGVLGTGLVLYAARQTLK